MLVREFECERVVRIFGWPIDIFMSSGEYLFHSIISANGNTIIGTVDAIENGKFALQDFASALAQLGYQGIPCMSHLRVCHDVGIQQHIDFAPIAITQIG